MGSDKNGVKVGADSNTDLSSPQAALVDILEAPSASQYQENANVHNARKHNRSRSQSRERFAEGQYHHQLNNANTLTSFRSRSSDRFDQSIHDLTSEFGIMSFKRGDR